MTLKCLRCFADVLIIATSGFSRNIRFELFQSVSLSILMPYLLPLIEDVMVDSHEIWWHAKHLLALYVETSLHIFFAEH